MKIQKKRTLSDGKKFKKFETMEIFLKLRLCDNNVLKCSPYLGL
jgi:hypothetical protein